LQKLREAPLRCGVAAIAFAWSAYACAAEPPVEPERPRFVPPPGAFILPPVTPPVQAPAVGDPRVAIQGVAFTGNSAISTADLNAVARPFVGRRAGAAEVEELRQAITRLYVERGYVSSGAVLESMTGSGLLTYRVVEGRLIAVRLRGLDGLDERYVARRLARDDEGPFNVEILRERFQILLGDPLFARMNARIVPGPAPGEAILDVDIERAPAHGLVAYANNYRPPSIGANGMGLRGWLRNVTGWGDVIEGSIEDSWEWNSGIRLSLSARAPLNASGTAAFARYERGRTSVIQEALQVLDIRSVLESAEAGITQSFGETLRERTTLGVSFLARENRTTLLGLPFSFVPGEPEGRTRTGTIRFWQEYAWRSERDAFVARSTFSLVRTNLQVDPEIVSPQRPDRRYEFWLGQAQYARRLTESGAQAIVRATIQRTHDRLLPLDALPIGGVASVRGYRENELIRDVAQVFNLELEWPAWRHRDRPITATLIPFADYAHGRGTNQVPATLTSVGVAGRVVWGRLTAALALAHKLGHPAAVNVRSGTLQDHGVHFEVTWALD